MALFLVSITSSFPVTCIFFLLLLLFFDFQLARVTLMLEFCLDVVGGVMIPLLADPLAAVRSDRPGRGLSVLEDAATTPSDAWGACCSKLA